nr:Chain C, INFLUENZA A MATRIX PROTEIN M1 (RESIDUES 58-66) [Influenza A virus]1HHI_F Chain F, INFLUENZA A MATRIX PROTEIN M1 (RESIDUES 58-66) [Influenza A virus]1OGA_C Chain C, GILGFVFTL [Homo sapiens]2VLJ_C Chain C, Flu Matrix Peptide [unidentified influenza virus]2VLK_C Chain C, Flu Matrix Peptide [unidentified influenza virus]2VLL_C Chain C, FLU MATRIX PEPTIDE [unidentified influenza virus]2VLL_F Chain F, FLU MATRIX PEPTIDE [unidentified influenza virus]2VLR_C Chain C, FLU MATRIX PEPTIDE [
GILGFVFTL